MGAQRVFLAGLLVALGSLPARADTFLGHSSEVRMQIDFQVAEPLIMKMLPDGWTTDVATSGGAKDCNLRLIFVDRVDITGPDDAPRGSSQLVYLEVPVKNATRYFTGRMVIGGLTSDEKDAPGPFGVYQFAPRHQMERSTHTVPGQQPQITEDWSFSGPKGEQIELHLKYERGVPKKSSGDLKMFSGANPDNYQIVKNVPTVRRQGTADQHRFHPVEHKGDLPALS